MKTKKIVAIVVTSTVIAVNLCACGKINIEGEGVRESVNTSYYDVSTSAYGNVEGTETTIETLPTAENVSMAETVPATESIPTTESVSTADESYSETSSSTSETATPQAADTDAVTSSENETSVPSTVTTEPASSEEQTTSVPASEPSMPSVTEPATIPETENEPSNGDSPVETGIYWLVGSMKNIFSNAGNYVGGFGKTLWTVAKSYINANPDTRFKAHLTDVMIVALEINSLETKLAKLDDKYDFSMSEMYDYAADRQLVTADIAEAYSEKYSNDVLGWLQQQYNAFKNVGKRNIYLSDINGEDCMIMKEEKLRSPGIYDIYVVQIGSKEIEENGFYKELSVYYEISDILRSRIDSDYAQYEETKAKLELKKNELEDILNTISGESND